MEITLQTRDTSSSFIKLIWFYLRIFINELQALLIASESKSLSLSLKCAQRANQHRLNGAWELCIITQTNPKLLVYVIKVKALRGKNCI